MWSWLNSLCEAGCLLLQPKILRADSQEEKVEVTWKKQGYKVELGLQYKSDSYYPRLSSQLQSGGPTGDAAHLSVYPIKMVAVTVISGTQRRAVALTVTLTNAFLTAVVSLSSPSLGIYLRSG